jgi:hypothetical protein
MIKGRLAQEVLPKMRIGSFSPVIAGSTEYEAVSQINEMKKEGAGKFFGEVKGSLNLTGEKGDR